MKQILETARLKLREIELTDFDFIADLLGNSEVMRYWPKWFSREEAQQWIAKQRDRYDKDGFGYWLAIEKKTEKPVGQAGLMKFKIDGSREIGLGYIIHRPFWQKGFATEAASACIQYAFQKLDEPRVIALIRPENESSKNVAQKLLMMPEGITDYAGFKHLIFAIEKQ
jgi:ribosomal-protein-alanine N-acetyltransferase